MSKPCSKKAFMEKLRFYLSLYFSDTERAGILADYEEWFRNESLNGRKEEEICAGFGEPKKIIQNLLAESGLPNGISLFFLNTFLQILFLMAVHFFANLFFLRICSQNGWYYAFFALAANFLYFLTGSLLLRGSSAHGGRSLRGHLPAVGSAALIFLFELVFLPRLTSPYAGLFCSLGAGVMLLAVFAGSLYLAKKVLPLDRQNGFLLLFHLSGIITLLFFLFNQLHILYPAPSKIAQLLWGSAGIYAETVVLGAIFYFTRIYEKG